MPLPCTRSIFRRCSAAHVRKFFLRPPDFNVFRLHRTWDSLTFDLADSANTPTSSVRLHLVAAPAAVGHKLLPCSQGPAMAFRTKSHTVLPRTIRMHLISSSNPNDCFQSKRVCERHTYIWETMP